MAIPSLFPLKFAPGVFKSGTEYQAKSRWYDTNLVRWYDQVVLGPILGWVTKSTSTVTGSARAIITWKDSTGDSGRGSRWAAIGTHSKLYAMDDTGVLTDITPVGFTSGRADATTLLGYGEGKYGSWGWGTPRPDTGNTLPATVWDLDVFGQYLVGCSHDDGTTGGKIYEWQVNIAVVAAVIANAPTSCYGIVVSPQRFLIALGAGGNPRKLQWCDQGAETVWTPTALNQAGSLEVPQGKLICGRAVGDQVLVLSDIEAHVCDYIGLPYVFSRRKVGDKCGAISKRCIVASGPLAAWWSKSGFWLYDGVCRPLPCDVWDELLRTLTVAQQSKISGFHNAQNSEFWWFYPGSGATENSNYVFWSYKYNYWNIGTLERQAGSDPGIFNEPFCVKSDGYIYVHESGAAYAGASPYARSGPVQIANGDRLATVLSLIPDEKTVGDVSVSFRTRNYPNGAETVLASTTLDSSGKADIRFSARQVEIVITGSSSPTWRWGEPRLSVQAAGRR